MARSLKKGPYIDPKLQKKVDNLSSSDKKQVIKIEKIKIIDFDKEKMNEKIRSKIMEKKGMKNIKVKFFN